MDGALTTSATTLVVGIFAGLLAVGAPAHDNNALLQELAKAKGDLLVAADRARDNRVYFVGDDYAYLLVDDKWASFRQHATVSALNYSQRYREYDAVIVYTRQAGSGAQQASIDISIENVVDGVGRYNIDEIVFAGHDDSRIDGRRFFKFGGYVDRYDPLSGEYIWPQADMTLNELRTWIRGFNAVLRGRRLFCNEPPSPDHCYENRNDLRCHAPDLRFDGATLWDENGNCSMVPDYD